MTKQHTYNLPNLWDKTINFENWARYWITQKKHVLCCKNTNMCPFTATKISNDNLVSFDNLCFWSMGDPYGTHYYVTWIAIPRTTFMPAMESIAMEFFNA